MAVGSSSLIQACAGPERRKLVAGVSSRIGASAEEDNRSVVQMFAAGSHGRRTPASSRRSTVTEETPWRCEWASCGVNREGEDEGEVVVEGELVEGGEDRLSKGLSGTKPSSSAGDGSGATSRRPCGAPRRCRVPGTHSDSDTSEESFEETSGPQPAAPSRRPRHPPSLAAARKKAAPPTLVVPEPLSPHSWTPLGGELHSLMTGEGPNMMSPGVSTLSEVLDPLSSLGTQSSSQRWQGPASAAGSQQVVVVQQQQAAASLRTCWHCGTTKTPLWRHGPDGPKTLCNACGIRHKKQGRKAAAAAALADGAGDSNAGRKTKKAAQVAAVSKKKKGGAAVATAAGKKGAMGRPAGRPASASGQPAVKKRSGTGSDAQGKSILKAVQKKARSTITSEDPVTQKAAGPTGSSYTMGLSPRTIGTSLHTMGMTSHTIGTSSHDTGPSAHVMSPGGGLRMQAPSHAVAPGTGDRLQANGGECDGAWVNQRPRLWGSSAAAVLSPVLGSGWQAVSNTWGALSKQGGPPKSQWKALARVESTYPALADDVSLGVSDGCYDQWGRGHRVPKRPRMWDAYAEDDNDVADEVPDNGELSEESGAEVLVMMSTGCSYTEW